MLRSAGLLAALLVALALGRQLGVPDVACGTLFVTSSLLAMARLLGAELRLLGPAPSVSWSVGLLAGALLPLLARVHPGPTLASGEVGRAGLEVELGPAPPPEVFLAISADMDEGESFTYLAGVGRDVHPVTLLRRIFRPTDAGGAHWHEDRPSAVVPIQLRPGAHTLTFEVAPAGAPPLRFRVFSPLVPVALPLALAIAGLATFLLGVGGSSGTQRAAPIATAMTATGVLAGMLATPDHAFRAALLGLPGGILVGLAAGTGLYRMARWARRRAAGSWARRGRGARGLARPRVQHVVGHPEAPRLPSLTGREWASGDHDYWDKHARHYDRSMSLLGRPLPRMVELAGAATRGLGPVLEVAAGTGLVTLALAAGAREVVATDYSAAMITALERRVRDARVANVRCVQADLYALGLADGTFDAVVAANVLHLVPDLPRALASLRRAVKPGGKVIVPTFCHDETALAWVVSRALAVTGFPGHRRITAKSLRQAVEDAGVIVTRAETLPGIIPIAYVEGTSARP